MRLEDQIVLDILMDACIRIGHHIFGLFALLRKMSYYIDVWQNKLSWCMIEKIMECFSVVVVWLTVGLVSLVRLVVHVLLDLFYQEQGIAIKVVV